MIILYLRHSFRRRPDQLRLLLPVDHGKILHKVAHRRVQLFFRPAAGVHRQQPAAGRVAENPAHFHLLFVEGPVVLLCRGQDAGLVRMIRLDQSESFFVPPAGPADRLHQQLPGALTGTVIAREERQIRQQHAHQRHIREIVALHNHLRPDQDVRLMIREGLHNFFMAVFSARRVEIHPQDLRFRKFLLHDALRHLRTGAEPADMRRPALRAPLHHRLLVAAVVADQFSAPVRRQRDVTVRALDYMAAGPAGDKARKSPLVQKQNRLLMTVQALRDFRLQRTAQHRSISRPELSSHIDDRNGREHGAAVALLHGKQTVSPGLRPIKRVKGRRRGSQQNPRVLDPSPLNRRLPRVVPGRLVALVRALLLLVDDNKPRI